MITLREWYPLSRSHFHPAVVSPFSARIMDYWPRGVWPYLQFGALVFVLSVLVASGPLVEAVAYLRLQLVVYVAKALLQVSRQHPYQVAPL
jgi:hypothetical protein